MRWLWLGILILPSILPAEAVRVACVGDSVTYGYGLAHREQDAYPARLQKILGSAYDVRNFGHNGTTLLRQGHRPYSDTSEFQLALKFNADIVIIDLGLNDSDPRDWPDHRDQFRGDYSWLIAQFRNANPSVQIFIAVLTPLFESHPRFRSGAEVWTEQIRREIPKVARANGVHVIDLETPLQARPDLFADALHPDVEGAAIVASAVGDAITGKFGGLQLPTGFSDDMVLPHGKSLILSGIANRGELVTVSFRGRRWITRASFDGVFKIHLPAQEPGGPYSLTVSTPNRTIHLNDILFGEIWLCSGQSNMDFPVSKSAERNEAIATANNPQIRLLHFRNLAETDESEWSQQTMDQVNNLKYFSGSWTKPTAQELDAFSSVGYFFALKLQRTLHMPVGIVQVSVGGSEAASWIDRKSMDEDSTLVNVFSDWRHSDFIMDWCRERADKNLAKSDDPLQRHPYQPSYNFEAGIYPLRSLPISGVIWYQGESDAQNPELYEHMFPLLVNSWRREWGSHLPFLYVQLSGLNRPSWPWFRDVQRRALRDVPDSGMVASYDLGEETNVHYLRKRAVGVRLADLALHRVYGVPDIDGEGATIDRAYFRGDRLVLHFKNAGGMLRTIDTRPIRGFQVEDAKGNWKSEDAIADGTSIILKDVHSKDISAVAYAWEPLPIANLINAYGAPAPTFLLHACEIEKHKEDVDGNAIASHVNQGRRCWE